MARKLGYGGIANTNGARDFSGKAEAEVTTINKGARFMFQFGAFRAFLAWIGL